MDTCSLWLPWSGHEDCGRDLSWNGPYHLETGKQKPTCSRGWTKSFTTIMFCSFTDGSGWEQILPGLFILTGRLSLIRIQNNLKRIDTKVPRIIRSLGPESWGSIRGSRPVSQTCLNGNKQHLKSSTLSIRKYKHVGHQIQRLQGRQRHDTRNAISWTYCDGVLELLEACPAAPWACFEDPRYLPPAAAPAPLRHHAAIAKWRYGLWTWRKKRIFKMVCHNLQT